jgi:surface protein
LLAFGQLTAHPMVACLLATFARDLTHMSMQFAGASAFNQDLSDWDLSSVEDMSGMFMNASSYNRDCFAWNVSNVVNFASMFEGATMFDQEMNAWAPSSALNFSRMFYGAKTFNQPLCDWMDDMYVRSSVTDMFNGTACPSTDDPVLSKWPVSPLCALNCSALTPARPASTNATSSVPAPAPTPSTIAVAIVNGTSTIVQPAAPVDFINGTACFDSNAELRAAVLEYMGAAGGDTDSSNGTETAELGGNSTDTNATAAGTLAADTRSSSTTAAAQLYGFPMNTWCFTENLTDLSGIFADLDTFNEEIYSWRVARVTTMREMFKNAKVR